MTSTHTANIGQQITDAWRAYVNAQLDHRPDTAKALMKRIDALLECVPREGTQ